MTIAEIFEARRAGYTVAWIHKRSGVSLEALCQLFREHDIQPEAPIVPETRIKDADRLTVEIRRMYWDENMTIGEIADHYGVLLGRVRHWMVVFGIPRRTIAEANRIAYAKGRLKPPPTSLSPERAREMCEKRWATSRS